MLSPPTLRLRGSAPPVYRPQKPIQPRVGMPGAAPPVYRPGAAAGRVLQSIGRPAIQRYTETQAGKLSVSGRILLKGARKLYAASVLIDQANAELRGAGVHGSLISLKKGNAITHEGKLLHAVIPTLDMEAYQRMVTAKSVGYHHKLAERNDPGEALALWADCARASAAVTGSTHRTHGDRAVRIPKDGQTELMVGYLPAQAHDPSAENPAASLANRVYLQNIYPLLSKYSQGRSIEDIALFVNLEKLVEGTHYSWQTSGGPVTIKFMDPRPRSDVMLAKQMYAALTEIGRTTFDQEAGINHYARPAIGEAYSLATEYTMPGFEPRKKTGTNEEVTPWAFHWGGVILKDPDLNLPDMVTLENYSVSDKEVTNREWNFEMYGSVVEQSFHTEHMKTNLHGTEGTTMAVATRVPQQRNSQPSIGAVTNVSPSRSRTTVQNPQSTLRPPQPLVNNSSPRPLPSVTGRSPLNTSRPPQQPVNNSSPRPLPSVSTVRPQTTGRSPLSTSRPPQAVNNSSPRPLPNPSASRGNVTSFAYASPQDLARAMQGRNNSGL